MAGLLFGFDTGIISGAQDFLFASFGIDINVAGNASLQGFVVAAVPIGALLGAAVSGFFAQRLGRRGSLLFTSLLFVLGTLAAALAPTIGWVEAGRLLMGIAIGISAMVAPLYLSEISPPQMRGTVIFLFQLAITVGILVAFLINLICSHTITDHNLSWRLMFGVAIAPSLLLFFGMLVMPRSPRWLVYRGEMDKAREVLLSLNEPNVAERELRAIQDSVRRETGGIMDLLKPHLFPLLVMSFLLFVFQQLSGINAIMYYGPFVFAKAGFGETGKLWAQAGIGLCNVFMTVIGVYVVDNWGRRNLLGTGFIGMILSLTAIGFLLKGAAVDQGLSLGTTTAYLTFFLVLVFVASFAISLGGVPYIIMAEVFPLKVRAAAMGIASMANWGFNILVSHTFPQLQEKIGMGNAFHLYALCSLIGLFFYWYFVPETKNRELEAIEKNIAAGKPLRHVGDPVD